MIHEDGAIFEMRIHGVEIGPIRNGYAPVQIETNRGTIRCRYYRAPNARRGAVWVGGVGGGWDTPAQELYPRLCAVLQSEGIASLRVRFRHSTDLVEAVLDVLAGVGFLQSQGIEAVSLTGHSFGGAVVIQAASLLTAARCVVTLATQSYGAEPAANLPEACSLLVIHGTADPVLPVQCSEYVYTIAHEPKRLILYEGAGHTLDEVVDQVSYEVRSWITQTL